MEGKAFGGGRGRGRSTAVAHAPPDEYAKEEKDGEFDTTFNAIHICQAGGVSSYVSESERGRSRCNGAGRGRGGAICGVRLPRASMEQHPSECSDRFVDVPPAHGSPSSPQSVVEEPIAHVETLQASFVNGYQQTSVTSDHGTAPVEKPVISSIGAKGELIEMKTNCLRLKLKPGHTGVVEYHVTIDPPVEDVRMRRNLLRSKEANEVLGDVKSFDGMILFMFLPYKLPNDVTAFRIHRRGNVNDVYKISVTFKKVRPMSDCIVFFNILLHRILRHLNYKERLEILAGTNITAENQEGLIICVDSSSERIFRQDTILDHLKKLKGDPQIKAKFEQFIINKVVITKYNYKCYKIDEVAWGMRPDMKFLHKGQETTVKEYLKRYHNVNIIYDCQPLLLSNLKPRKNEWMTEGEEQRIASLVPECCCCNANGYTTKNQKSNLELMTDLAESTALVPAQRVADLEIFINRMLGDEAVKAILGDWGVYIEKTVETRKKG